MRSRVASTYKHDSGPPCTIHMLSHTGSNPPECLTPTLEDCALSEMLVKVANKDKHYIGGEMINEPTKGVPLVGQT